MNNPDIPYHREVQRIARQTMQYLRISIREGMSEEDIANLSDSFMLNSGIESFWYHGVGSLVLVGERTKNSVSGTKYKPSSRNLVGKCDLVTVDLSPQVGQYWGDYARSFVVENGKVASKPTESSKSETIELFRGDAVERLLHKQLKDLAVPEITFGELYVVMNRLISELGYKNLDFHGNLGHTIETKIDDRKYIEKGNNEQIGSQRLFTFEPHIKRSGGKVGFKREDIYYFSDGKLRRV